jgi:uncharacterized alkaline shock family protein YloU
MNAEHETIGDSGYTLEDLSDYLDRGRVPAVAEIDNDPACQAMLASLERMTGLSQQLVAQDAANAPPLDEHWLGSLLATIGREVRAGRDIELATFEPGTRLTITEGAVRELIRAAGDSVDGVLVGSCALVGDVSVTGDPVTIEISISVVLSAAVTELAQAVRERVRSELLKHTELTIGAIDVTVVDVHQLLSGTESAA